MSEYFSKPFRSLLKRNLASLKTEVDTLDIDLNKLSDVANNDGVKKLYMIS